jgi:hypothetical protein
VTCRPERTPMAQIFRALTGWAASSQTPVAPSMRVASIPCPASNSMIASSSKLDILLQSQTQLLQVQDGIAHHLSGSVVGNIPSPVGLVIGGLDLLQKLLPDQQVVLIPAFPQGVDMGMLAEQADIAGARPFPGAGVCSRPADGNAPPGSPRLAGNPSGPGPQIRW